MMKTIASDKVIFMNCLIKDEKQWKSILMKTIASDKIIFMNYLIKNITKFKTLIA